MHVLAYRKENNSITYYVVENIAASEFTIHCGEFSTEQQAWDWINDVKKD